MATRRVLPIWVSFTLFGCVPALQRSGCPERNTDRSCAVIDRGRERVLPSDDTDDDAGSEATARDAIDAGVDTTRVLLPDQLLNARDLGGVRAGKHAQVAYGEIFRGPPLLLSPVGCDQFAELGVRTIIDLRIESERADIPDAPCAADASQVVLAPLPVPYDVSPTDYIADLDASDSIASAFAALGDDAAYPIYFHCTYGRDRTGILAAVILRALGVDRDDVMHEYSLSQPNVGAFPDSLAAALDEIERRGGVEAYLAAAGVKVSELATLRKHALVPAP